MDYKYRKYKIKYLRLKRSGGAALGNGFEEGFSSGDEESPPSESDVEGFPPLQFKMGDPGVSGDEGSPPVSVREAKVSLPPPPPVSVRRLKLSLSAQDTGSGKPGVVTHVQSRGTARQEIKADDDDKFYYKPYDQKEHRILVHLRSIDQKYKQMFVELTDDVYQDGKRCLKLKRVLDGRSPKHFKEFNEDQMRQIIIILKVMAMNNIYDADTNPENYLIDENENIVRIDFGGTGMESSYDSRLTNPFDDNDCFREFKKQLFIGYLINDIKHKYDELNITDTGIYNDDENKDLTQRILYYLMLTQLYGRYMEMFLKAEPGETGEIEAIQKNVFEAEFRNPVFPWNDSTQEEVEGDKEHISSESTTSPPALS